MQKITMNKVILRKGGAVEKPKPAPDIPPGQRLHNPKFKNPAGKRFFLFPVGGRHECA